MKPNLNLFFLGLAFLLLPTLMMAQRTISGVVTDAETGDPLIGANVLIIGTSTGTITDIDGSYTLELSSGYDQLQFSYTGYTTKDVAVSTSDVVNVSLSAGELLDEVVVIGYGTVKKEDATGAIQSIAAKDFNKGAITSAQQLVTGKVAGVQITNGADPGSGSTIRIRGGSSLSATNDPLIIIDGVPVENGGVSGSRNPLNLVNPNDIESISVLKDASATAIYGSRASNGVIIVTTKKGKAGQSLRVNYTGNVSIGNPIELIDVLSADEYRNYINERYEEGHPARGLLGSANTDWQEEIYEQAIGTDHNLSLSGAFKEIPYRVSLGYTDMDGVLQTEEFNRTTASLNLNPGFFENRLQVNVGVKTMFTNNRFANRGAVGSAVSFDPTQPVFDDNSEYGGYFTWVDDNGIRNTLAPANPLALLQLREDVSDVQRILLNGSADYRFGFLPALRANLNLAYDYSKGEGTIDVPGFASFAFDQATGGGVQNTYSQTRENKLLEFYLNYVETFNEHKLDVMAGYSYQSFFNESTFRNSNIEGSEVQEGEDSGELFLLSVFGRLNYTYNNRYLFTFTLRQDGTSRFSPDNRWGLFPAAAAAVKVIDNSDATVSTLKVRAGWGITGQQDIGGFYGYLPRYQSSFDDARYLFGDTFYTTLRPNGYNSELKWEETTTYNAGIDFGFLGGRITGSLDYYLRKTDDLLNNIRIPAGTNLTNFIDSNVGSLENTGVEVVLNTIPVSTNDITWELGFNAAYNQNEITNLTSSDDPTYIGVQTGGISGGVGNTIQVHTVGFPSNSFLVYEQVYDVEGNPVEGLYVDRNGDGLVNNEDFYRLEKPAPDWIFGLFSSFNYKDLTVSFAGRANVGNYVYNNILSNLGLSNTYASTNYLLNVLTAGRDLGMEVPQLFSDHFIQEGSFFRLDHITVAYNFSNLSEKFNLGVSASVQNPVLVTDYTGIDPELSNGIDGTIYPRSRTFVFGVNLGF
jgi:iron complex outermembrane receptor protein